MSKGTPTFTVRLSKKTQDDLREMAAVYGAPNARAFAREMLETMCSGDMERIKGFNTRLIMRAGEQLALRLNATLDEQPQRIERTQRSQRKPRKPRRRGRRGT